MTDSRSLTLEIPDDVPNEIIELIFASADYRGTALCHLLCLVSKIANKAATPLLYSRIEFCKAPQKGRVLGFEYLDARRRKMKALSRTLARKPHLVQYVKEVKHYFDDESHFVRRNSQVIDNFDWEYLEQWKALLEKTEMSGSKAGAFVQCFMDGKICEEAFLSLLLLVCSNVRRVELTGDMTKVDLNLSCCLDPVISKLMDSNTRSCKTGINNIRELVLDHTLREYRIGPWDFQHFFQLPSLQKLSTNTLTDVSDSSLTQRSTVSNLGPGGQKITVRHNFDHLMSRTIKSLEISRFGMQYLDSPNLTEYCPNLTSLRIEWEPLEEFHGYVDWRRIGDAIRLLRKLEHLTLDSKAPHIDRKDPIIPTIGLGGLRPWATDSQAKGCPCLKKLTLPKSAIFGSRGDQIRTNGNVDQYCDPFVGEGGYEIMTLDNFLPDSVEELSIICDDVVLTQEDRDSLTNPGSERLKILTIYNFDKSFWTVKKDGEDLAALRDGENLST